MGKLIPKLDILPASQLRLWEQLAQTPHHFVLYDGTALALRLGHRQSVDFDFFSSRPFQPIELLRSVSYLKNQRVTQQATDTLSCDVEMEEGPVRISFFGGLSICQISAPDVVETNGIAVASLMDLFGMKCATVAQRNELKDYLDIHALLTRAALSLPQGIAAARAIYGQQYDPLMTLQALSYFDDLMPPPDKALKADLLAAVKAVSLNALSVITPSASTIGARIADGGKA